MKSINKVWIIVYLVFCGLMVSFGVAMDYFARKSSYEEFLAISSEMPQKLTELQDSISQNSYLDIAKVMSYFAQADIKYGFFPDIGGRNPKIDTLVGPIKTIAYGLGIEYIRIDDGMGGYTVPKWNNAKALNRLRESNYNGQLQTAINQVRIKLSRYEKKTYSYFPFLTMISIFACLLLGYVTIIKDQIIRGRQKN